MALEPVAGAEDGKQAEVGEPEHTLRLAAEVEGGRFALEVGIAAEEVVGVEPA